MSAQGVGLGVMRNAKWTGSIGNFAGAYLNTRFRGRVIVVAGPQLGSLKEYKSSLERVPQLSWS